jgi:hypothetical protein
VNAPPQTRESERRITLGNVTDVCAFVDALEASAVGELVVEQAAQRVGVVLVEGGRICWAAASGLARRLTELLAAVSRTDAFTMEGHYRACKELGVPLGEHLVGRGIVSADQLRGALLQHTAESLAHLARGAMRAFWRPRMRHGYSARFTFGSAELLARVFALQFATSLEAIDSELDACFPEGKWAAAFARPEACAAPVPVSVRGAFPASATVLRRVGAWAASSLDVAAALSGASPLLVVTLPPSLATDFDRREQGESLVTFRHRDAVLVGETNAQGPARVLNRRAIERRKKG